MITADQALARLVAGKSASFAARRASRPCTQLFVILGHEGCGAVQAALAAKLRGARERRRIALLLDRILPGLRRLRPGLSDEAQVQAAVEANVRWAMHQLLDTHEGKARMAEGIMKLVGAIYELKTGRVRFL